MLFSTWKRWSRSCTTLARSIRSTIRGQSSTSERGLRGERDQDRRQHPEHRQHAERVDRHRRPTARQAAPLGEPDRGLQRERQEDRRQRPDQDALDGVDRLIASTSPTPTSTRRTAVAAGRITRTVSDRPSSGHGALQHDGSVFPAGRLGKRAPGTHTPVRWRPPPPTRIVQARAGVAVYERGEGEPVLLVGGFPDHAIGLLPLAESLAAAGFRAIVAAYPGYAPSEPLPDDDYAIPSVAADLVTVMETVGAPRFSSSATAGARCTATAWRARTRTGSTGWWRSRRRTRPASRAGTGVYAEQKTVVYAYLLAYAGDRGGAGPRPGLADLARARLVARAVAQRLGRTCSTWSRRRPRRTRRTATTAPTWPRTARRAGVIATPTTVIYGTASRCIRATLFAGLEDWFDGAARPARNRRRRALAAPGASGRGRAAGRGRTEAAA